VSLPHARPVSTASIRPFTPTPAVAFFGYMQRQAFVRYVLGMHAKLQMHAYVLRQQVRRPIRECQHPRSRMRASHDGTACHRLWLRVSEVRVLF
jgi:hypothetical protein